MRSIICREVVVRIFLDSYRSRNVYQDEDENDMTQQSFPETLFVSILSPHLVSRTVGASSSCL